MTAETREWKFRVKAEVLSDEYVFVVGNCSALGNWNSNEAVPLTKEEDTEDVWSCVVPIPVNIDVQYRYCVCFVTLPEGRGDTQERRGIVRRWETHWHPRMISKQAASNLKELTDEDVFGFHDNYLMVDRGWLTTETVIQFIYSNNPLQLWKRRYLDKKVYIKVTPVSLAQASTLDSSLPVDDVDASMDTQDSVVDGRSRAITEIAVLNKDDYEFKPQEQFGHAYNPDEFVVINISIHNYKCMAYLVDFFVQKVDSIDEPPTHIGLSYILPSVLMDSAGQAIVPITSVKHIPIGQLTVEYLIIQPIVGYECDMNMSYSRFWKKSWLGLDVGHRGLGTSFKLDKTTCSDIRENTIASLKTAASHGADFVEFDVQLTKDLVPVLYHDFHVSIGMKRKKELEDNDLLHLPLKDLTLQQLQSLKVYHVLEHKDNIAKFSNEDLEEHQPFPTLQQALEALDPHVGFNVEIKWTMQLEDGSYELYHPFELNMYLDIVLKVVLEHAGSRKIVFSCFHPDICTMIRLKQNKYPVMFLTQGITKKYPPYRDYRTRTVPMAVYYALSAGILGINVHTEDILRDPSLVKFVRDTGLVMFCWGEDNNNTETIKHLKKLGLHAVIYDKINEFGEKKKSESIFLVEAREAKTEIMKVVEEVENMQLPPVGSSTTPMNYLFDISKTCIPVQEVPLSKTETVSNLSYDPDTEVNGTSLPSDIKCS